MLGDRRKALNGKNKQTTTTTNQEEVGKVGQSVNGFKYKTALH